MTTLVEECALCKLPLSIQNHQIQNEDLFFCCKGCQVVHTILESQNALENFSNHPVFQQALKAGLITNPHFQSLDEEQKNTQPYPDLQKLHLVIDEMWCPSCAQVIHLILLREKGIKSCFVDYSTDLAVIEFSPHFISKEKVLSLIKKMGYSPSFLQDPRQKAISRSLKLRFIVAVFFSLNVMMFAYPIYATYWDSDSEGYANLFAWLSFWGSLPVIFYSAWPIWKRFFTSLKVGIWGMETLVCLGVSAATGLSLYELSRGSPHVYFDSMTVIIVFVLLGKIIESKAKFSAKDALLNLALAMPRKGRKRFHSNHEAFVSLKEIHVDDLIVVYMGEKIVLDGIVEEGSGACDESVMTGECKLIPKTPGSLALAGSVLQQGYLVIKVTAKLEETALHRIIDMVSQEMEHKTHYVRIVDQIIKWFVPFVFFLSVIVAIYCFVFKVTDGSQTIMQTAIIRMVSVLLISCPCAIGIAAPLVEAYVLNALAKVGVIVRNRGCLNFLGRETIFAFDKTGTVTLGRFEAIQGIDALDGGEKGALKGLVAQSIHPIALAINQILLKHPQRKFEKKEEVIGKGIKGECEGHAYCIGSSNFLKEQGIVPITIAADFDQNIFTKVYFTKDGKCLSEIVLGDSLREDIQQFIQSLKTVKTVLISGDSPKFVKRVAEACGIQTWFAECTPFQKKVIIDDLKNKGEIVAMLGDGINDAPALTAAHVGIAVVSATDISIQVSDVLLTNTQFNVLTILKKVASLGHQITKQNIFWAFFYNVIGLLLAAFGSLTPLFAAFAMVVSSLIVLGNAHRITTIQKINK